MRQGTRTVIRLGVGLLALGGAAWWWLIADGAPPAGLAPFALDLAAIRAAAGELPGSPPTDIRVEQVASFSFPGAAIVAGDGWNAVPMGVFSYQLVLPVDSIIIDTALDEAAGKSLGATLDPASRDRVDAAMADATQIVVTHEHADHAGGVVTYPEPERLAKGLHFTAGQIGNFSRYGLILPPALAENAPLDYQRILAIAPGVVLVRAPGHTPGSQMVYVRRADGRELLFIGDIAWAERNLETGRGRPRLLSQFILGEDRDAVFAELATLGALRRSEPNLLLVPGHDPVAIEALVAAGAMARGFVDAGF
jgi:glyoxylase-like metal-dependent hydrolase (beta-lactamase superfamily II)